MALYRRPLDEILLSVAALNGVVLIEEEYTFGPPVSVIPDATLTNTSITVTAASPLSPYDGSVPLRYTRLDLADLLILVPVELHAIDIVDTLGVVDRLNTMYGIGFLPGDIVSMPVTLDAGKGAVTLMADPLSLGWQGQVTFNLLPGARPLTKYVTHTALGGLNYPTPNIDRPYASMYSYWRDFTPYRTLMETVTKDSTGLSVLFDILKSATGDPWTQVGAARFSLDGAVISYIGPTVGAPVSNTAYDKVIIVDLLPLNSLGWSGSLIMHYNLPNSAI